MFEGLLGNVEKQQEEIQQKLAQIIVEAESGDGAVVVKATGDLSLANIKIDPTKLDMTDREQIEDLVLEAANRALELARQKAGEESAKMMKDMFPFGDLDQFMKGLR